METVEELTEATASLLNQLGIRGAHSLAPLPAGANNRVYRVDVGARSFFLKHYFHQGDERVDPLGHEWGFTSFCWERGLRCVAQPLARDAESRMVLLEFVPGRRVGLMESGSREVAAAAEFFGSLNRHRRENEARALPAGRDAAFDLVSFLDHIDRRVAAFDTIELKSPACELAAAFVRTQLAPVWSDVRRTVEHSSSAATLSAELDESKRCLSPVDFGFHNVLIREDETLLFHDFEEAGWDDPARLICDFFCQCQLQPSAPLDLAPEFCRKALEGFDAVAVTRRASLLWPATIVRWTCILLTDFLPVSQTRRTYAGQPPSEMRRHRQLDMAERLLARHQTPLLS